MGSIGNEPALYSKGILQAAQQIIECIGELAQFVLSCTGPDAMGKIVGRDLLYFMDDECDGSQQLSGKEITDQGGQADSQDQAEEEDLAEFGHSFQAIVVMAGHDDDKFFIVNDLSHGDRIAVIEGKKLFSFFLYFADQSGIEGQGRAAWLIEFVKDPALIGIDT